MMLQIKKNQSREKNQPDTSASCLNWHAPMLYELKIPAINTGHFNGAEGSSGYGRMGSEES